MYAWANVFGYSTAIPAGEGDLIKFRIVLLLMTAFMCQVEDALTKGAALISGGGPKSDLKGKGRFFSPTCLASCNNTMKIMCEESFGPIVGVEEVFSDEEAIQKINDSKYGLTSSIFTASKERALKFGEDLPCGTVYMNRCDTVDPLLPWSGQKDSGKGISLSKYGFTRFTRLKAVRFCEVFRIKAVL